MFLETATMGIIFGYDNTQGIEQHVDADFSIECNRDDVQQANNVLSRSGCDIFYARFPLL